MELRGCPESIGTFLKGLLLTHKGIAAPKLVYLIVDATLPEDGLLTSHFARVLADLAWRFVNKRRYLPIPGSFHPLGSSLPESSLSEHLNADDKQLVIFDAAGQKYRKVDPNLQALQMFKLNETVVKGRQWNSALFGAPPRKLRVLRDGTFAFVGFFPSLGLDETDPINATTTHTLPDNIVRLILRNLSGEGIPQALALSHVCFTWRTISQSEPSLWTVSQDRAEQQPLHVSLERGEFCARGGNCRQRSSADLPARRRLRRVQPPVNP